MKSWIVLAFSFTVLMTSAAAFAHEPGKSHAHQAGHRASAKYAVSSSAGTAGTLVMRLSGLHCEGCAASVGRHLAAVPGVVKVVSVSAKEQKAVVRVGKTAPKTEALKAAVSDAGYHCVRVEAKPKA